MISNCTLNRTRFSKYRKTWNEMMRRGFHAALTTLASADRLTGMLRDTSGITRATVIALLTATFILGGCVIAPMSVMEPLKITVADATTDAPIANASIVYIVCDVHDSACTRAKLVRAASTPSGHIDIEGQRTWGVWFPAPGGLPAPNHFIAIWAPGYSPFLFSQYEDTVEKLKWRYETKRPDILEALNAIPIDALSSNPTLDPVRQLSSGKIRLRKAGG